MKRCEWRCSANKQATFILTAEPPPPEFGFLVSVAAEHRWYCDEHLAVAIRSFASDQKNRKRNPEIAVAVITTQQ